MKTYKYIGYFKIVGSNTDFKLEVSCLGFVQAFFLLTADAIRMGRFYQLSTITDEKGEVVDVEDILKVRALLKVR